MAIAPTQEEVGKLRQGTLLLVCCDGQLMDVTNYYAAVGFNRGRAEQRTTIEEIANTAAQYKAEAATAMQYASELRAALAGAVEVLDDLTAMGSRIGGEQREAYHEARKLLAEGT